MSFYKKTLRANVIAIPSENKTFPMVSGNAEYEKYLAWVAEGNVADPAETPEEEADRLAREADKNDEIVLDQNLRADAVFAQLRTATQAQISTHINNLFSNLSAPQRNFLKWLTQAVVVLLRKL